jgi:predicted transposase YbfD/YdcC
MVKGNQAGLEKKVAAFFDAPDLFRVEKQCAATRDTNRRGRIEERTLTLAWCPSGATSLPDYTGFAAVQAVFRIERRVVVKKTGEVTKEQSVLGITSLSPQRHDAGALLSLIRGHWSIENKSHYVRDVTFGEDGSQVREGNVPQVMAALRNAAISVMRLAGWSSIAAACRFYAARPKQAIRSVYGNRTE